MHMVDRTLMGLTSHQKCSASAGISRVALGHPGKKYIVKVIIMSNFTYRIKLK